MKLISYFALLGFLLSACISINQVQSTPLSELETDTQDREILEGNAEITIPLNATEIYGNVNGLREITTHVRFTTSPNELNEFLTSILCTPSSLEIFPPQFTNGLDRPWWRPTEARQFQWCEGENQHIGQSVFIDTTNSQVYGIYVIASTH